MMPKSAYSECKSHKEPINGVEGLVAKEDTGNGIKDSRLENEVTSGTFKGESYTRRETRVDRWTYPKKDTLVSESSRSRSPTTSSLAPITSSTLSSTSSSSSSTKSTTSNEASPADKDRARGIKPDDPLSAVNTAASIKRSFDVLSRIDLSLNDNDRRPFDFFLGENIYAKEWTQEEKDELLALAKKYILGGESKDDTDKAKKQRL